MISRVFFDVNDIGFFYASVACAYLNSIAPTLIASLKYPAFT